MGIGWTNEYDSDSKRRAYAPYLIVRDMNLGQVRCGECGETCSRPAKRGVRGTHRETTVYGNCQRILHFLAPI